MDMHIVMHSQSGFDSYDWAIELLFTVFYFIVPHSIVINL